MGMLDNMKHDMKMKQLMARGATAEAAQQRIDEAIDSKSGKTLAKVGLDLDNASPTVIKQLNAESIRKIRSDMVGNGLAKAGSVFGGSVTERATLGYLSALTEQNWILIRQNELLIKLLDKSSSTQ